MTAELKDIVRQLRSLAENADRISRRLEVERTDHALHRIAASCRDLHSAVADALKALPPGLAS